MTEEEIAKFLGHPFPKLVRLCKCRQPDMLKAILSIAIQESILHGRRLAYGDCNSKFLSSYNEISIAN